MRHIKKFNTYNESLKDYVVVGAIAASSMLSPTNKTKANDSTSVEYRRSGQVEIKVRSVESISYDLGFDGLYDIKHTNNINKVFIYNSKDKQNRKRGEIPETELIVGEVEIKFILKKTIIDNIFPVDFKLIPKSTNNNTAWSTPDEFTKHYLIQIKFEEDMSREEKEIYTEITIIGLKKGSYSFNVGGDLIKFTVN